MLASLQDALAGALRDSLPLAPAGARPELQDFYALVRDYPERPGKHLRGLMLLLSCLAHGGRAEAAMPVAVALELFQNWVLIHDDIEDDSEERRGRPALHRTAGMPVALNVGDMLHVHMWDYLHAHAAGLPRREDIRLELSRTIRRTAEGQHLDLAWVQEGRFDLTDADYLEMVTLKTAHYTVIAPLRLGALAADRPPDPRFEEAGRALGVAFQIRDDVLNLKPGAGYGKEAAGDLYEAKRTLILAYAFARATPEAREALRARLAKPRAERSPEDVRAVLDIFEDCGAVAAAQAVAEVQAAAGLARVRAVLAELPDQRAAGELARLLESLARRDR